MDERQINIFTNPLETVKRTSTAFCVEWKWSSKQVQYPIKYSLKLTIVKKMKCTHVLHVVCIIETNMWKQE